MSTVLFANPPWFVTEKTPRGPQLRGGIRAGSRWPFTRPSPYMPDRFQFGSYMPYPFFLGSAAAYVAKEAHGPRRVIATPGTVTGASEITEPVRVLMRDSIARGESYNSFFSYLIATKPNAVVIETGAASWEHDLGICRQIKKYFPGTRIAIAGPTAANAAKTTEVGIVDAWLIGEYEKNAALFVAGADGVLGFNLLTRDEMNEIPLPMFDEPVALHYWDACPKGQKAPHLQLLTSRGCPYKCSFCAWPANMTGNDPDGTRARTVRFHSPEWVEAFIREFIGRHPETKSVYLDDDTFNLNDGHTLRISEVMGRIGLPWSAMCRADTSERSTWKAMKDAGCFGVKIGFESGVQRVVDEIVNKKLNLTVAEETARWLRDELGITVHGTFTVGLPGETPEEKRATMAYIQRLMETGALDTYQLSGTATIEGTPLDRIAKGETLAVYPGAKVDGNFVRDADGQHKAEAIR